MRRSLWILFGIILCLRVISVEADVAYTHGFYPLWENTGRMLEERHLFLGTNQADIGITSSLQLGTEPLPLIYRTPNFHAKFRLLQNGSIQLAYQSSVYVLLPQIAERFFSPMYSSRLDNGNTTLPLWNHSIAFTYSLNPWVHLHSTTSGMILFGSKSFTSEMSPGEALSMEFNALSHHSILWHFGEIGFWKHDLFYYGFSYRYASNWFELQLGYFYRESKDGRQSAPLLSLGVSL